MPLKELTEAVLAQARARSREEVERSRASAAEAVAAAGETARRRAAEAVAAATAQAAREEDRARGARERERRLTLLAEKNRQLDLLFAELAARFAALPAAEKDALYRQELASLALGGSVVKVPAGRARAFAALLPPGVPGGVPSGVKVEEDPALPDGFVVESASSRLDRTEATRLREAREELSAEAASLLFPEKR